MYIIYKLNIIYIYIIIYKLNIIFRICRYLFVHSVVMSHVCPGSYRFLLLWLTPRDPMDISHPSTNQPKKEMVGALEHWFSTG